MRKRTELIINLEALRQNFVCLESRFSEKKFIPMIKANAYGHGADKVLNTLAEFESIEGFGLASLEEAVSLRKATGNRKSKLIIFSDTHLSENEALRVYEENNLIPVISNFKDLKIFLNSLTNIPLYLKFNTGMNRLGFNLDEVEKVISILKDHNVHSIGHLMSHFSDSCSELTSGSKTQVQLDRFNLLKETFKNNSINLQASSISNSGAIEQSIGLEETHLRPGLMLYGPSSLKANLRDNSWWRGRTVSSLKSIVLKKIHVNQGDEVGYSSTQAPTSGFMLIVGIGYGDGLHNSMQEMSILLANGVAKVLGRVSMDMTAFLVEGECEINEGDDFFLWSHDDNSLQKISEQTNIIPYEILCSLGERVSRSYRSTNLIKEDSFAQKDNGAIRSDHY